MVVQHFPDKLRVPFLSMCAEYLTQCKYTIQRKELLLKLSPSLDQILSDINRVYFDPDERSIFSHKTVVCRTEEDRKRLTLDISKMYDGKTIIFLFRTLDSLCCSVNTWPDNSPALRLKCFQLIKPHVIPIITESPKIYGTSYALSNRMIFFIGNLTDSQDYSSDLQSSVDKEAWNIFYLLMPILNKRPSGKIHSLTGEIGELFFFLHCLCQTSRDAEEIMKYLSFSKLYEWSEFVSFYLDDYYGHYYLSNFLVTLSSSFSLVPHLYCLIGVLLVATNTIPHFDVYDKFVYNIDKYLRSKVLIPMLKSHAPIEILQPSFSRIIPLRIESIKPHCWVYHQYSDIVVQNSMIYPLISPFVYRDERLPKNISGYDSNSPVLYHLLSKRMLDLKRVRIFKSDSHPHSQTWPKLEFEMDYFHDSECRRAAYKFIEDTSACVELLFEEEEP
ncbi:hypothetical protein ADUPG1_006753 [Aduncisulcus paluster]|uniref:Uncharacterized protein n=1 Tax=Aduncisulcus paluster TaxID=2918883 RepID=A0ABQ5KL15_9EUKA|nr:hypothetical protein ADUPG1_006753 [Aduncisulcus paluster]